MPRPQRESFPLPLLITESAQLAAFCERMRHETFVTVDTEFMRERTYWPELCVVQLAGEAEVAIVDALAPGLDLAPLGALLADQAVTKVFHAARQDIEIFVLRYGDAPRPLFDTQVAAMVAGFGDQVGYDSLVSALTGGQIDKAHRFSDWSARPLSPAQTAYAAADVTWLREVYVALLAKLEKDGRLDWVAEEMAELADPATYRPDPESMWERLRPRTNNRRLLGVLRAVAAWREREAQRSNVPRQRMLKDESLLELAATAPATPEALARVRGITRGFAEGRWARPYRGGPRRAGGTRLHAAGAAVSPGRGAGVAGPRRVAEGPAGGQLRAPSGRAAAGGRQRGHRPARDRGRAGHSRGPWLAGRGVRTRRGRPQGGTRVAGGRREESAANPRLTWVSAFAC